MKKTANMSTFEKWQTQYPSSNLGELKSHIIFRYAKAQL